MKRFLLGTLAIVLATTVTAPIAMASQTDISDLRADENGDGIVSLSELRRYNRRARHSN